MPGEDRHVREDGRVKPGPAWSAPESQPLAEAGGGRVGPVPPAFRWSMAQLTPEYWDSGFQNREAYIPSFLRPPACDT